MCRGERAGCRGGSKPSPRPPEPCLERTAMDVDTHTPNRTHYPDDSMDGATRSRRRRVVEAVAFVAVWVAAGYLLRLSSNPYLLLGVPLTAAFQALVRRRPVRELFASGTTRFALTGKGAALAIVLAATPAYYGVRAVS